MKALSLWQPWASLIACGGKRIETRHWPAPQSVIGQRVAVHAAKRTSELRICSEDPFINYIHVPEQLPLGALVATAVIDRCVPMTRELVERVALKDPDEFAFGHYEVGRYAWALRDVVALAEPVPFRGAQGIFDVPDDLLGFESPQLALATQSPKEQP